MTATTLIIETARKRATVKLPERMGVWGVREYCRQLMRGIAPETISLSGDSAIASYAKVKYPRFYD